ncbi:membrane protein [Candidatus Photodesmus katoptron]|uniref:YfgM family protein n=1 Tax=Candidatus Photodesmus anomalopis TaxID=28176 RepID=UPI0004D39558|nr:tetratricopeptide repeat protein [Candidatus Photodesmus katoptron]KEY89983.1 membrane protein [Candidatus Photodesmus katoptron]
MFGFVKEKPIMTVKKKWHSYAWIVFFIVIIGLAILCSWIYYQDIIFRKQEIVSQEYVNLISELKVQTESNINQIENFIDSNKHSEYSILTALQLAKVAVEAGNFDEALSRLQWAKTNTRDKTLSSIISYRIARIQLEQADFDAAIFELSAIKVQLWESRVKELHGDILLRKGDIESARSMYVQALKTRQQGDQILKMKLNDLGHIGLDIHEH